MNDAFKNCEKLRQDIVDQESRINSQTEELADYIEKSRTHDHDITQLNRQLESSKSDLHHAIGEGWLRYRAPKRRPKVPPGTPPKASPDFLENEQKSMG